MRSQIITCEAVYEVLQKCKPVPTKKQIDEFWEDFGQYKFDFYDLVAYFTIVDKKINGFYKPPRNTISMKSVRNILSSSCPAPSNEEINLFWNNYGKIRYDSYHIVIAYEQYKEMPSHSIWGPDKIKKNGLPSLWSDNTIVFKQVNIKAFFDSDIVEKALSTRSPPVELEDIKRFWREFACLFSNEYNIVETYNKYADKQHGERKTCRHVNITSYLYNNELEFKFNPATIVEYDIDLKYIASNPSNDVLSVPIELPGELPERGVKELYVVISTNGKWDPATTFIPDIGVTEIDLCVWNMLDDIKKGKEPSITYDFSSFISDVDRIIWLNISSAEPPRPPIQFVSSWLNADSSGNPILVKDKKVKKVKKVKPVKHDNYATSNRNAIGKIVNDSDYSD